MTHKVISSQVDIGEEVAFEAPLGTKFLLPVIDGQRLLLYGLAPLDQYGAEADLTVSYRVTSAGGGDKISCDAKHYLGSVMLGSTPLLVFVERA